MDEVTSRDVLLRHAAGCDEMVCLDWVDEPERIEIANAGDGAWVLLVVTEKTDYDDDPLVLLYDLLP